MVMTSTHFTITVPLDALPLTDELAPKILDCIGPARQSKARRALYSMTFKGGPVVAIEAKGSRYWSAHKIDALRGDVVRLVDRLLLAHAGPTIKPGSIPGRIG